MTNKFLQINKDLFKLGLKPIELLILAQVMEYDRTTGEFFESDEQLAKDFGVSTSTVSRAMSTLEGKGLITRSTKNVKNGRVRHVILHFSKLESLVNSQNDA